MIIQNDMAIIEDSVDPAERQYLEVAGRLDIAVRLILLMMGESMRMV